MKIPKKVLPQKTMKVCNICGEMTLVYQVIDNAPVCFDCVPEQKIEKKHKVPNENQMLNKILDNSNVQKSM
jgi:hypothetical protein